MKLEMALSPLPVRRLPGTGVKEPSIKKATVPLGVRAPTSMSWMVAKKVTGLPTMEGSTEAVTWVVVCSPTSWSQGVVLLSLF